MSSQIKIKVMHLTPHLGGGVGSVLLNFAALERENDSFDHCIECLDEVSADTQGYIKQQQLQVNGGAYQNISSLLSKITESDILIIHWWNHPLLYDFMIRNELPPTRVIIWSHVSGFNAPNTFNHQLLSYPDKFIFTTPLSFNTKEVSDCSDLLKKSFRTIWSTSGLDHISDEKLKAKKSFRVGYIGTLDYAKLHPDFLIMCNAVNIPDVKFVVCGDRNIALEKEASAMGLSHKIEFTGRVSDVNAFLKTFDVFGYPLAPYHYGTCDQVLAESMAAGVVPVVLSNPMEKNIVKDGETGIVANCRHSYVSAIEKLYKDEQLKITLSERAQIYARERFSLTGMIKLWRAEILECLHTDKTRKNWPNYSKNRDASSADIFLETLGNDKVIFSDYRAAKDNDTIQKTAENIRQLGKHAYWRARTKGTVHQYSCFFKNDKQLKEWSMLIDSYESSSNLK